MASRSVWILLSCCFGIGSYRVAALDVSVMFEDVQGCHRGADYEQGVSLAFNNYIRRSCNCSDLINGGSTLQCSNVSQFHGLYQLTIGTGEAERAVTRLSQLANISASIVILGVTGCADDGVAPTTAVTTSSSNTLLVVLLATCTTLLLLLTAVITVTMYKCYQLSKEVQFGEMKPAPLQQPAVEEPHAVPYEVAFSRIPAALEPANHEGRPAVYIPVYDIATIPNCQEGDDNTSEQAANVNQAIDQVVNVSQNQAANVSQAIDQVDVTPSDIYPGYVQHTSHS